MARILGIDYGKVRSGIALTDILQISINPIGTINTPLLLDKLKELLNTENISELAIGWPLHQDGSEVEICSDIDKLINKLMRDYPELKVAKIDESFSSREASKILVAQGKSRSYRQKKGNLDKLSAVLIIKRYLDSKQMV